MAFMIPIVKKDFELYLNGGSSKSSTKASSTSSGSSDHLSLSSSRSSSPGSSPGTSRPTSSYLDQVVVGHAAPKFQSLLAHKVKSAATKRRGR
uniref:Putative secreted protein n=1 Tax=Ixodes ricinus TaxID=34613 RepID=A0A131Y5P4_IXORI